MALVTPVMLVDNLSNPIQYPLHVVSAEEEPTGNEAFRFATGRRDQYATATTANSDWWHKTTFNVPRAFDMVCLWVHNLAGESYQLQASDDDFTTTQTVINVTIPSTPGAGDIDDANGVHCENGMWLKRFSVRTAMACRHFIPAMGAGLKPQIAGMVGLSYAPGQHELPFSQSEAELKVVESETETGWIGRGPRRLRRAGTVHLKTRTAFDYDVARYHFETRFMAGHPMLIVHDDAQAERAVMAVCEGPGRRGFKVMPDWPQDFRVGEFPWVELDAPEAR